MAGVISIFFIFLLVALVGLYLLGTFILQWFRYASDGFYTSFFYRTVTGLVASVFLFSLFAASFKTVQWGILMVAIFLWYEFRISGKTVGHLTAKPSSNGLYLSHVLPVLLLAAILFGWFAYSTFHWHGDFMYAMPHKDKVYYTNISTALIEFGYENRQGAYYPNGIEPVTEPYHYFDLWFTAMLSFFTGKPAVLVISLLCLPICALITVSGILSIFERVGTVKPWHIIMAVLLLFTRGLYLETHDPQIMWAENFTESVMEFKSEKLGVLYVLGLLSFRIFLSGNLLPALVSFLVLPVVSIGNLPGVIGGLLLFAAIALIRKKMEIRDGLRIFGYCAFISAFIYCFYHFTGEANVYLDKGLRVFTDVDALSFQSIKVAMVELVVRVMNNPWRTILMHAPFLIIAWLGVRRDQHARTFILIACIYLVSLATYGMFYKLADSPQFYTNNLPLLNVFLIIGATLLISSSAYNNIVQKSLIAGLAGILCILVFFDVRTYQQSRSFTELYSGKYLREIDSLHQGIKERSGVAILYNPCQKPDLYNCDMSGPNLYFLSFFPKFRVPVDLNVFEARELTWGGEMGELQKRFLRRSPFQKFVLRQVTEGKFRDLSSSQLEYLESEHIRYLFVSPGIAPDHRIVALVRKRIKDERSGEQLLLLNEVP